jgi:flagellar motility protein MotE (MotC chaperone)
LRKIERSLFRLSDQISDVKTEIQAIAEEFRFHADLHDDAENNAVAGHAEDRVHFGEIKGDKDRFAKAVAKAEDRLAKLESKRDKLLRELEKD